MSDTAQTPNSNTPSNNTKDSKDPVQTVISNENNDILLSPVQLEKVYSNNSSTSVSKSATPTSSLESMPRISITQVKNTTKKVSKISSNNTKNNNHTTKTSSSKRKHKKNVCFVKDCNKLSAKFIGDCNFCNGHFCSNHRLMESHHCKGLDNCKEQLHQKNADKLNKEQTIVPKIQI